MLTSSAFRLHVFLHDQQTDVCLHANVFAYKVFYFLDESNPTLSSNSRRHFIGFQFVSECSLRRRCWYGSVCTTQRHVTWQTSVCRRRLRTVVASLALQSPGPSWCPGLGRLLSSAALLRMAQDQEPTTNGPPITRTVAVFIQAPAQDPPVPALDSAGCSCGYRAPSSGAVVQRVRRRLQMFRLNSKCYENVKIPKKSKQWYFSGN